MLIPRLLPVIFCTNLLMSAVPPTMQVVPIHAAAIPCDDCVPGVINFAKISDALWRGAQPTAEGFKALEKMGLRTVVSFRSQHDDFELLQGTRLKYLRIESHAGHPEDEDIVQFLKVIQNPANHPVFIHCAQGRDRTGVNAAAYRMVLQGWSAEEAIQELKAFRFNKIWITVPRYIRKLNPEQMKNRVDQLPTPKFRVWAE